jgi:N-acetylglucosaminyl-diphospho-decaprenol L-rhamnosyltransferase
MLIYSSLLRSLGGYDPVMRSHEAQDLAIRLEKRGVKPQFDPSLGFCIITLMSGGRTEINGSTTLRFYLIRKHGIYRWLTDH